MTFNQLKIDDQVYILEVLGTFKKITQFCIGSVTQVSMPYDEPLQQGQIPIPGQPRRKLVDITVTCDGEVKKLSVQADKSSMIDQNIGLTIATEKQHVIDSVRRNYNECKAKLESMTKYEQEMNRCKEILDQLEVNNERVA